MQSYLKKYGHTVLDNGYEVIPITPGRKSPNFDFTKPDKITHKLIDRQLSNGHSKDGMGIRTRYTPFLDIDCPNEKARNLVTKFAEKTIGIAPIRIGNPLKLGVVYRTDTPFSKVQSPAFRDPEGQKCQVEFLGDGQQFVSYAVHPETHEPYYWIYEGMNPLEMRREELPVVTREQAQAICDRFTEYCVSQGWLRWGTSKAVALRQSDPDDIVGDTSPLGFSVDVVKGWVDRLPNDESVEYEDSYGDSLNYRNVIFAIFHELGEEGREIAWEWSEKSPKHEQEEGRFDKLWRSSDAGDLEYPVTFRYIIKSVLKIEEDTTREQRDDFLTTLKSCTDGDDLKVLAKQISAIKFEPMDFERLAQAVKEAFRRINGVTYPIERARKDIAHRATKEELPEWVKPWVYIQHTNIFYNKETGAPLDQKAFDATFSRNLDGAQASFYALNTAQIKTFSNSMYNPGADEEFMFEGRLCINTFSERLMPSMPEKYSKRDRKAIKLVEQHLENLLPDERERGIFTSYLAYIVQTNLRINWSIVLQGIDGDGKSFFGEMMGAVYGGTSNIRKLDPQTFESTYTGWSIGQVLSFVEELRIHGHSRYDVLNKIKPYITNPSINVHPKNVNPYTALNTTSYLCFTNSKDALAITKNDRRYCVLYSPFQSGEAVLKFEAENPGYFKNLYGTIDGPTARPGALRKWLMNYELHSEFEHKGRAPLTAAREEMIEYTKTNEQMVFDDAIEDDIYPRIGPELVVSSALIGHFEEKLGNSYSMKGRTIANFISQNGYVKLPFRVRLSSDSSDNMDSIWVKNPKSFQTSNLSLQRYDVLKFIKKREILLNHGDEV